MGLMWNDFGRYNNETLGSVFDDLVKSGFVGAFMGDFDAPYRNGVDSYQVQIQNNVGPEASYIAVNTFPNSAGNYARLTGASTSDRKVFIPATCENPVAAMLYIDFISTPEVIEYLQLGVEGINHEVQADGSLLGIAVDDGDPYHVSSQNNIDLTITLNGLDYTEPSNVAITYALIDSDLIYRAIDIARTDRRIGKNVRVGEILSEEGIIPELNSKRDVMYINAIAADPSQFDSVWDGYLQDLLQSGLQAIMDERAEKWTQVYGSVDMLPEQ
jgi:putative aldouronate transport system substrate-binding protein